MEKKIRRQLLCGWCREPVDENVCGLRVLFHGLQHENQEHIPFHPQCIVNTPVLVGMTPSPAPFSPNGDFNRDELWHLFHDDAFLPPPPLLTETEDESESESDDEDSVCDDVFTRDREAFERVQSDRQRAEFVLDMIEMYTPKPVPKSPTPKVRPF